MTLQDLSEFQSGVEYDAQYQHLFADEIQFLSRLAEQHAVKTILDICCGTGIVTVPLAQLGYHVCGVDIVTSMLEQARNKAGSLANIELRLENALTMDHDRHYDLAIMTGNAFQAFLRPEDIEQLLLTTHRHLNPQGLLVFDSRMPEGYDFSIDADFRLISEYLDPQGRQAQYLLRKTRYDADPGVLYFDKLRRYSDGSEQHSAIEIKFTPFSQLQTLLNRCGFLLQACYCDWQGNCFSEGNDKLVMAARAR